MAMTPTVCATIRCSSSAPTSFLANFMRLLLHAAAYILHQQLRTQALRHTALPQAQPSTVINKLFKIAVQARQSSASYCICQAPAR